MNSRFAYVFVLIIAPFFITCKKEDKSSTPVTVSLMETGLQEKFIRLSGDTIFYNVAVNIEGDAWIVPNKAVSVVVDPSLLTAYNTASGTHFELLPDSVYSATDAKGVVMTGSGQIQLPVYFFTKKINPYTKYVLPLKLQPGDLDMDPSANTVLLKVLLSNDYTGAYADTITSAAVLPTYPFNPAWNFTDSIVHKNLTALNDSIVIIDAALPSIVAAGQHLVMSIDTASGNVKLGIHEVSAADSVNFVTANALLQPYYRRTDKYFYIPYNYFNTDFRIKERLKRL